MNDLLGPGPETAIDEKTNALGTWVEVPPAERDKGQAAPSNPVAEPVPVRAGRASGATAPTLRAEGRPESR